MGDKDFFLSPDDAMSMGDIDYMRTSKRTRRTFPKTLKNKDGFSFENDVSSMEDRNKFSRNSSSNNGSNSNQNASVNTVFNPTPSSQSQPGATGGSAVTQTNPTQPKATYNFQQSESKPASNSKSSFDAPKPAAEKRRPADSSMDMFRNMAKNIKRK